MRCASASGGASHGRKRSCGPRAMRSAASALLARLRGSQRQAIATHTSKRGHAAGGSPLRRKRPLMAEWSLGCEGSVFTWRVMISLASGHSRSTPAGQGRRHRQCPASDLGLPVPRPTSRPPDGAASDRIRPACTVRAYRLEPGEPDSYEPVLGPMVQRQPADRPELLAKLRT